MSSLPHAVPIFFKISINVGPEAGRLLMLNDKTVKSVRFTHFYRFPPVNASQLGPEWHSSKKLLLSSFRSGWSMPFKHLPRGSNVTQAF